MDDNTLLVYVSILILIGVQIIGWIQQLEIGKVVTRTSPPGILQLGFGKFGLLYLTGVLIYTSACLVMIPTLIQGRSIDQIIHNLPLELATLYLITAVLFFLFPFISVDCYSSPRFQSNRKVFEINSLNIHIALSAYFLILFPTVTTFYIIFVSEELGDVLLLGLVLVLLGILVGVKIYLYYLYNEAKGYKIS